MIVRRHCGGAVIVMRIRRGLGEGAHGEALEKALIMPPRG